MLEVIDVSQEVTLIEALSAEVSPSKREQLLRQLHKQQDDARAALKEQADALEKAYEEARGGAVDPARLADIALEKARADAERVRPAIEALQQKIAVRAATLDPEIRQSIQKSLDILEAWLPLYQGLREKLLKLADALRDNSGKVLRARPVEGEIEHEALSREFMARFPKIRAALAK
jgi:Tfp pilus assembly protein PilE